MTKQVTLEDLSKSVDGLSQSISDLAISFSDMATMVSDEFKAVRREIIEGDAITRDELTEVSRESEKRIITTTGIGFAEVYANQRETNERLERLETSSETLENDVRDMYEMIGELQKDVKNLTKEERLRLADLEDFAMQVAEKTGIPFKRRKPKLKS